MTDRTITYVPLAELRADPANPKTHSVQTIGESVERFGFVEPIILDARTGYMVSGHGRAKTLRAAQERGDAPPDGVRLGEHGSWLIPAVTGWASENDMEARGALIALNRSGELGGWADDALLALLADLSESEAGFAGIGFGDDDLAELRARLDDTGVVPPMDEFPAFDEDLDTHYRCPSCAYEWSGNPRPESGAIDGDAEVA